MKQIPVEDLLIDLQNPTYDVRNSQREAITTIAHDQGLKLVNLAEDIIDKGLNPSEVVMVTPFDESNYVVLGGKCLGSMNLNDISNGSLCIIDTRVLLYGDRAFQKVTEIKVAMPSDIH